ncbi:site-specific integrase [Streptomyces sp. NPDC021622]|uniref:tyrosine-type recombinase/integrase n=1 Tax=Streptomyces sp. NPDC021622 TaxID=3155013 RepID=UPI003405730B
MASIRKREKKDGSATYQVRWIQGGRGGSWEDEKFGDEDSAAAFRKLVEAHGNQWPHGWVQGRGFVEPDEVDGDEPILPWAHRYVDRLTGVDARTKRDYHRDIDNHFGGISYTGADGVEQRLGGLVHTLRDGTVRPATVCTVTQDDVTDWVTKQEKPVKDPEDGTKILRRKASPKSIANRHGLLFCIFQAAITCEPSLRTTNPCAGTRLPRQDDGTEEEMTFLEHNEYAHISAELRAIDPAAADLADFLVGTGLRWGEASALQTRDVNFNQSTINVQRAWKRQEDNSFELGPPKTKKARRALALTVDQMDMVRRLTTGRGPEDWVFRGGWGKAWRHSNFYHRKWERAVKAAVEKGLTKKPRLHDLRHTHVAWLIAKNIPLPAIQLRLGHESITTTVDRYGHLVRALDGEITAAVEAAMPPPPRAELCSVKSV